jgi:hypothetical protein
MLTGSSGLNDHATEEALVDGKDAESSTFTEVSAPVDGENPESDSTRQSLNAPGTETDVLGEAHELQFENIQLVAKIAPLSSAMQLDIDPASSIPTSAELELSQAGEILSAMQTLGQQEQAPAPQCTHTMM